MNPFRPIRFKNPNQALFVKTLRKRVDDYFKENDISRTGGFSLKVKAAFMFALYFVPYFLMVFSVVTNIWVLWAMAFLMALGMAGLGFCVMHDANHGVFSRKKWLNNAMGYSLNFLGGNVNNWKAQHNILHHSYTNVEGFDEDIDPGKLLRFSPHAEKKKYHKYQFLYAWPLYSLMTLAWTFKKDMLDAPRYEKMGIYKQLKTNMKKELLIIIGTRLLYFFYMLFVPMYFMEIAWWQVVIGFFTVHLCAGLLLALIFQLAHVMEDTQFPLPEEGSLLIENQWAVHQLQTTLNFSAKSRVLSWFVGGLNFQIEHHLFPNISHVHYKNIAPIVKQTALEYGLPYYDKKTFFNALASHGRMLYQLGR